MAQCYHCGSSVYTTDRFCMECGTEHPAQPPAAPGSNPLAAPAAASEPPAPAQSAPPVEVDTSIWQKETILKDAGLAQAARAARADEDITCPNCAARLPRGARFCGDCGARLPDASAAASAPAPARSSRVVTAALPDPIPPLNTNSAPRPATGPVQPVLPPFRASSWAAQPTPPVELSDETLTPLSTEPAAPANGQATPGWGGPPAPAPWRAPQPPPWQAGPPQGSLDAGAVQQPGAFPPGPAGAATFQQGAFPPQPAASPSQALFLQKIAAIPPLQSAPSKRRRYPRGQVITMLIASAVTVLAAFGGALLLLLSK